MQDLRFGGMLSFPSSGLPTTLCQAELVMLVEDDGVGALGMLREFEYHVCSFIWSI
jgi:hypothetical protein